MNFSEDLLTDPRRLIEQLSRADVGGSVLEVLTGTPAAPEPPSIGPLVELLKRIEPGRSEQGAPVSGTPAGAPVEVPTPTATATASPSPAQVPWTPVQQELRLWCSGGFTGGRFVVVNERTEPERLRFEPIRPAGLTAEQWAAVQLRFSPHEVDLGPDADAIVALRVTLDEAALGEAPLEFCVDVRGEAGTLLCKLWVEVVIRSPRA